MRPIENSHAHDPFEPVAPGIPEGLQQPDELLAIVDLLADAPISLAAWSAIKRVLIDSWPRAD